MGYFKQGMAGGGAALEASGLKILQSVLDEQRQKALMEVSQEFQRQEGDKTRAHQTDLHRSTQEHAERIERDVRQPFLRDQQDRTFKHSEELERGRRGHAETMQRQTFEHSENLARINRAHAEALANMGAQLLPDPQSGKIAVVGKNGEFRSWLTDKEGNTITGAKDLSASTKAYVDTIRERLKALDKEEAQMGLTPDQQQTIAGRRMALTNDLLGALTTGKIPEQAKPAGSSIVDPFASRSGGERERPSRAAAAESPYDAGGNLREPPVERAPTAPRRTGADRRMGINSRRFIEQDPELLNEE